MQVGDRWVYSFHNKGDKLEPVEQWQQVLRVSGTDAWLYSWDGRVNTNRREWVSRWDQKRAKAAEFFAINLAQKMDWAKELAISSQQMTLYNCR